MRRKRTVLTMAALLGLACQVVTHADTSAPTALTTVLQCNGSTLTFVSPVVPAMAAQVAESTGVGVLLRVSQGTEVLFEFPAFKALLPAGKITTCTSGPLTFTLLLTPPR